MTFFLVVTTSFWLYNLFALMKEVRDEIVNIIMEIGEDCHDCVEFLPDYTILYSAVVSYWLHNNYAKCDIKLLEGIVITGSVKLFVESRTPAFFP